MCKMCGATRIKIVSTTASSRLITTQQHKSTPQSLNYHLKAAVLLNKPRATVSSPAVTLKQFLYDE